jgi:hypothetical protein
MFLQTAAALSALVLIPFGSLNALLEKSRSWQGFDANGAKLLVVRAEKWDSAISGKKCRDWVVSLLEQKPGTPLALSSWTQAFHLNWEPWTEEELSGIHDCEAEPCKIKLNPEEVLQMKKVEGKASKLHKYQDLVIQRSEKYFKTGERKEYEFPGKIADPWSQFEAQGLTTDLPRPERGTLWVRKLDFAPGQAKALHQVVDRRVAVSGDRSKAVVWIRDAYTDHYFDSWGEWTAIQCEEKGAWVVQALFLELDLLKKTDLFSKLMRGKLRAEVEAQGQRFLSESLKQFVKP